MVNYISTRGMAPVLSFADAALTGLARDGGLYVPDHAPQIARTDLFNMHNQKYIEVATSVIAPFVAPDIASMDLMKILLSSYRGFDAKDVTPLRQLDDNLHLLELFHGPTFAFKDVAMQFLGKLFDHLLQKKKQRLTIVGATSGDTGSAAIEAFRDSPMVDIVILHPKGRTSDIQRKQMTTVLSANVMNIAVEGSFDDCQHLVKQMFADHVFRDRLNLSAVNSINWARIVAQAVYYVYASTRLVSDGGRKVSFTVPTGNFGNVCAGFIAKSMGAPIGKLIVATNKNDILHRFITTGEMSRAGVQPSLSPSMDIQIASNFERILFQLCGRDGEGVAKIMDHFQQTGRYTLAPDMMDVLRTTFASGRKGDVETLDVIAQTYKKHDVIVDPHTAVGLGVAADYMSAHPDELVVSLATAYPGKFPDAVEKAIGFVPDMPPVLAALADKQERYSVLPNDLTAIQKAVLGHAERTRN